MTKQHSFQFGYFRFSKIVLSLVLVIFLFSCTKDEDDEPTITNIAITGFTNGASITLGSLLEMHVEIDNSSASRATVLFDNVEQDSFTQFPFDFNMSTVGLSEGSYTLSIVVYNGNKEVGKNEMTLVLVQPVGGSVGSVTDVDGNTYKTIQIGTQVWMSENLRTLHYRNGDEIPQITDNDEWIGLTTGACCYYNNDNSYATPYGCLYNFYAVNDAKNICPKGWHVPSRAEIDALIKTLQGEKVAGGKLKEAGSEHWTSALITTINAGTNESGFTAVPGGVRTATGAFSSFGYKTNFWFSDTATSITGHLLGYSRYLGISNNEISCESTSSAILGHSVRCIKD